MSEAGNLIPHRLTFIWKRSGDCALVVHPGGGRVLLNPKATKVWELIDDRRSVPEIKKLFFETTGFPEEDVEAFLASMVEARILTYESFLWAEEPES